MFGEKALLNPELKRGANKVMKNIFRYFMTCIVALKDTHCIILRKKDFDKIKNHFNKGIMIKRQALNI